MMIEIQEILIVGHSAGHVLGGAELSLLDNVKSLNDLGKKITVILPNANNLDYVSRIQKYTHDIHFLEIPWNKGFSEPDPLIIEEIMGIASHAKVQAILSNTVTMREPLIAARRLNIPAVCIVREIPKNDSALAIILEKNLDQIVSEIDRNSDYIIANSKYTLSTFGLIEKSAIVRNVYNSELLNIEHVNRETFNIGFVGSVNIDKGILDFVSIARNFENYENLRFFVFGAINDELKVELRENQPQNIEFMGYESDPVKIYSELDLVLQLSTLNESFSRTVVEAKAAGKPVIAYDVGAVSELFEPGDAGVLVKTGDLHTVIGAIKNFSQRPEIAKKMGEVARNYVKKNFSPDAQVDDLRKVLEHIGKIHSGVGSLYFKIGVSQENRSHFKEPFMVGNRARFATATGVRFISDYHFIVASLLGKSLYLFEFDPISKASKMLSTIDTQNAEKLVSVDAIDFNGRNLLITSDCEFSTISIYEVSEGSLNYKESIQVGDIPNNYIHGARFISSDSDIVAATVTEGKKGISFISRSKKKRIGHFSTGDWGVKDMSMLKYDSDRFIAVCTQNNVGTDFKTKHAINIVLVQTPRRFMKYKKFKVIDSYTVQDASIETIAVRGNYAFLACQSSDSILVMRYDDKNLYKVDEISGFSLPHGVDISPSGKWMAVASYGTSSVDLVKNVYFEASP